MKAINQVCDILTSKEGFSIIRIHLQHNVNNETTYFLLDTGSSESLISADIAKRESNTIPFRFSHNGRLYTHVFTNIAEDKIQMVKDYHISGIIGFDFLLKNQFVIDFGRNKISSGQGYYFPRNYSFLYPIRVDKSSVKVPIVGIKGDSDTFACLVDSGANYNLVSCDLISDHKNSLTKTDETIVMKNIDSLIHGYSCHTMIHIASLNKSVIEYVPYYIYTAVTDTEYLTHNLFRCKYLKGILGNEFLQKNHWIIDLKKMFIYSPR